MPAPMPLALHPFLPVLSAACVVLLVRLLARWRPALAPAALPLGLLAGAALLLPFNPRAFWAPRVMADHLLLAALAGLAASLLATRLHRRWVVPCALAVATGWWVAQAPPALPEFWRAGFAVTVYVLLLARASTGSLLAASLTGAAALLAAGAAPVWQMAMLVPAASCAALLAGGPAETLAASAFLAAAASLASLAGGRLVAGRFTAVDAAALVPLAVAWCWPTLSRALPSWPARHPQSKPRAATGRVAVRRRRA